MPVLSEAQQSALRVSAAVKPPAWNCHVCGGGAKDYCRSCDEFYLIHDSACPNRVEEHDGHRLTIVPFVEIRGRL